MEWSDSLSVGVIEIDAQHKELIHRVNSFYASLKHCKNKENAQNMLKFLSDYVVKHFTDEERMQTAYNYPGYPEHKKLHTEFMQTVKEIKESIEQEGVSNYTFTAIATTMSNWLVTHISVQDKKLGIYMSQL